ncbi:MAG: SPOR domain-containing protein [Treponema sp.]|nr:SPOR domain-containing protein [Treponema sp.]
MEQKKTLWIIAAVGLFLLVVLGAAMFLYPPSARTAPAVATINPVERKTDTLRMPPKDDIRPTSEGFEQVHPFEDVNRQNVADNTSNVNNSGNTLRANDLFVVSENTTVYDVSKSDNQSTTIDLNALRNEVQAQTPVSNINITVNLPDQDVSTNVGVPVVVEVPGETKVDANGPGFQPGPKFDPKKDSKWDSKKGSKDSKTDSKADTKKDSATTATASNKGSDKASDKTAEVKPAQKTIKRFWVQVAAYSNKKTAENARTVLDNNKIPADIFTYQDNKNRLFYRVRVGPYTTKSEAEYWKAKIEKISDFAKAESYVTSTIE